MIGRLQGKLIYADRDTCLIDVGGVGYEVHLPESTRRQLPQPGQPLILWCRQLVREDDLRLYGFLTLAERELFEQLLTVSGVGPRAALAVLSTFSPERFRRAIALGEAGLLVQIPGVGRRTAERWIVEFRNRYHWTADRLDRVEPAAPHPHAQSQSQFSAQSSTQSSPASRPRRVVAQSAALPGAAGASGPATSQAATGPMESEGDRPADGSVEPAAESQKVAILWEQTLAALLALGYSDAEAMATLDALTRAGQVTPADSVQDWVRAALRRLSPGSLA